MLYTGGMTRRSVIPFVFILSLLFLNVSSSLADVYTYTDESGNVHYVDDPSKIPDQYRGTSVKPHELGEIQHEKEPVPEKRQLYRPEARRPSFNDYSDIDLTVATPSPSSNLSKSPDQAEMSPKEKRALAFLRFF